MSRIPVRIGFDHRVDDDQELSDTGGEDYLRDFTGGFKALAELLEDGVMSHAHQGGHVENTAQRFAAAADEAFTGMVTAVVGKGSNANESGDFLPVEFAEFREFGNEGGSGHVTDTGNGFEKFETLLPIVVGFDKFQNRASYSSDVLSDGIDGALDAASDQLGQAVLEAVRFGSAELDQLAPAGHQLVEFVLFFRGFGHRPRFDIAGKASDDARVDVIGLGQDAVRFGEVAHLPRIDHGDKVPRSDQFANDASFVPTGSFEHNAACPGCRQLRQERGMPLRRVRHGERAAFGKLMTVEG